MTRLLVSTLLLFVLYSVSATPTIETNFNGVPVSSGYPGRSRRTHSHLPKFSKNAKGKGKGAIRVQDNEYVWVYEKKSSKESKSKKSKKGGKKEKYVRTTRKPTVPPFPTVSPAPSSVSDKDSQDIHSGSDSEDCPPDRPPSVVPGNIPTQKPSIAAPEEVKAVAMNTYALDYTLLEAGSTAPSKADFREVLSVTSDYFKEHMLNAYKISTQADLFDFTTSFVTAQFTPGAPIHIQYNSTAFFNAGTSVSIPTSETLMIVLKEAVEPPTPYINTLKEKLSEGNPFASTTNVVAVDPKATPTKRSIETSTTSVIGIASAGALMVLTLAMFVGIVRGRKDKKYDDEHYNESFNKKQDHCDTTVAGETFVSEINDSTYDGNVSTLSSSICVVERNNSTTTPEESSVSESETDEYLIDQKYPSRTEDESIASLQRPRTVAEIEQLLSMGYGDVI